MDGGFQQDTNERVDDGSDRGTDSSDDHFSDSDIAKCIIQEVLEGSSFFFFGYAFSNSG